MKTNIPVSVDKTNTIHMTGDMPARVNRIYQARQMAKIIQNKLGLSSSQLILTLLTLFDDR